MMWPSRSASWTLPCARISATAWRTVSPTRNCRCEPPGAELFFSWWRGMLISRKQFVVAGHSRLKDGVAYARLCPAIHVFLSVDSLGVDARDTCAKTRFALL